MSAELSIEDATTVINSYGAVLAKKGDCGAIILDAAILPYSKEKIKSATLLALRHVSSIEEGKALISGYLSLADFQPGVGTPVEALASGSVPTTDADIARTLQQVLDRRPRWEKWTAIANKELEILNQELRANGF
jgi:hypothetical protein